MKRMLLTLALMLGFAASAHAQCSISNSAFYPGGPFTGYSNTLYPGSETFNQYEVDNTNPVGTCPITYCFYSFLSSIPGMPVPSFVTAAPSPSTPACKSLVGGQNFIAVNHWTTRGDSYAGGWVAFGTTPPFKYLMGTQVKANGTIVGNVNENLNVLDYWGNTVTH
jgi:hypothetical protein